VGLFGEFILINQDKLARFYQFTPDLNMFLTRILVVFRLRPVLNQFKRTWNENHGTQAGFERKRATRMAQRN
jgi:hypothetical protein